MTFRIYSYSPLLLCSLLVACTTHEKESTTHSFRTYVEDGVTIAETTGGPKYDKDIFSYEKAASLVQDETVEESLLYRPGLWLRDEGGYFYVEDNQCFRL